MPPLPLLYTNHVAIPPSLTTMGKACRAWIHLAKHRASHLDPCFPWRCQPCPDSMRLSDPATPCRPMVALVGPYANARRKLWYGNSSNSPACHDPSSAAVQDRDLPDLNRLLFALLRPGGNLCLKEQQRRQGSRPGRETRSRRDGRRRCSGRCPPEWAA